MFKLKTSIFTIFLVLAIVMTGCSTPKPATPKTTPPIQTTTTTTATTATIVPTSAATTTTTPTTTTPVPKTTTPATTTKTPASTTTVFPTTVYVPSAAQYKPTGAELELFQYAVSLINADRQSQNLPPVTLAFNAAAQKHAQDMFDNFYISHWGTDGWKPYMRYTIAGGLNREGENSAYSGWFNSTDNPNNYQSIIVRDEIAALEYAMMYDDAASNWGHRDTIINKDYTKVSLGIVYDDKRVALVQQFESDYVEFYSAPTITGGNLSLLGKIKPANTKINNISIAYDPLPQKLTNPQLTTDPAYTDGYGLGERLNFLVPPAPAGQQYTGLSPQAIIAGKWEVNTSGQFAIQANIGPSLSKGKGVYTIVIVAVINGESVNLTNYSVMVE